jgi:hypothetical protein
MTVTAEDGSGHPVTSFNGTLTLGLTNDPDGGALGGTITATAVNGVATFPGVTLSQAASGYELVVTGDNVGEVDAGPITVTSTAQPSVSLASSATTPVYGQPVTFTATVSPATATGTVTFLDGTATLGTGTLNSSGVATLTTDALPLGASAVTAVFGGATSAAVTETVSADGTTTAVTSSANPDEVGQPVTFTATVSPDAPGALGPAGSVQFNVDGKPLGSPVTASGGVAVSPSTSTLALGSHTVTAVFTPDSSGDFLTSTGTLTGQKVLAFTSTTLSAGTTTSTFGQPVTFTASVTNLDTTTAVTGSVTFYDGTRPIGAAAVSGGQAVFTTSALAAGAAPYAITAVYNGSVKLAGSTSGAVGVTVAQAATTVALTDPAAGPVAYGTSLALTAQVSGVGTPAVPTGAVRFYSGTTVVGSAPLRGGVAEVTVTLPAGSPDALTAVYLGSANFTGDTSPAVNQEVDPAQTSASLSLSAGSIVYGQGVTFTAAVANTDTAAAPTGLVRFYNGATLLGAAPVGAGGVATLTRTNLPAGSYSVTASYVGTANFAASASSPAAPLTVAPDATTATLTSPTGPTEYGQPVTFNLSVSTTDTATVPTGGTVTFYLDYGTAGQKVLGYAGLSKGAATFTTKLIPAGSHSVTAVYMGTANFQAATSNAVSQSVGPASTAADLNGGVGNWLTKTFPKMFGA